jgi:hypothetical protein
MNEHKALAFGSYLHSVLPDYVEHLSNGGTAVDLNSRSGDWKSGNYVRASSVGLCAKLHAMERLERVKKEFDVNTLMKFEIAVRAAELYAEAVVWAIGDTGEVFTEKRVMSSQLGLAGTMDILIKKGRTLIPVEVKYTSLEWREYQLWQLVAYMELVRANVGYLVTLYKDKNTHAVWTLVRQDGTIWMYNSTGETVACCDEGDFDRRLGEHHATYAEIEAMGQAAPPYETPFEHWQCGYFKNPEYYKVSRYDAETDIQYRKGDLKPNTGFYVPSCPLCAECYGLAPGEKYKIIIEDGEKRLEAM